MVHPQTSIPFKMFYVHAPFSVEAVCTQRREGASESHFTPYRALCSEMAQGGPNETKKKKSNNIFRRILQDVYYASAFPTVYSVTSSIQNGSEVYYK